MNSFKKEIIGKILMILLPVIILVVAVLLFVRLQEKNHQTSTTGNGNKDTAITPTQNLTPSRWATDSGVLLIEENLKSLTGDLEAVNLRETDLLPPVLDMKVKF